eukprot:Transcript_10861.p1 GENE.Transcript_10861~~Transcript_10861.p1  ORF type:complete len:597 (+),score=212.66 Transcript_10861:111-1901(+)
MSRSRADLARVANGARLVAQQVAKLAEAGQFRSVPVHWEQRQTVAPASSAAAAHASRSAPSASPVTREDPVASASAEPSEDPQPQGWRAEANLGTEPLTQRSLEPPPAEPEREASLAAQSVRGVPTTPLTRAVHFGGLGLGLAAGAAAAAVRRATGEEANSLVMTEANVERLASTLCRLRGAALKVGQMLSFNDSVVLSPALQKVMERVRDGADWMPDAQLQRTLDGELGDAWREQLTSFDDTPVAAASIGQVHRAVLSDGRRVAVKVQYPGVAQSIGSDLWSMQQLVTYTGLVPPGMFVDRVIKVAKRELLQECDYTREAENTRRYKLMLARYPEFAVPAVVPHLSTRHVLTTEWMPGVPIDRAEVEMAAAERDRVGARLLWLSLAELFTFRFMQARRPPISPAERRVIVRCSPPPLLVHTQTDPNWSNFLYEPRSGQLSLIDFGACQEYDHPFSDNYLRLVRACAEGYAEREAILHYSRELGFLTGDESSLMLEAHVNAAVLVGSPFAAQAQPYDFGTQDIAKRIASDVSTMIKHRLTPPREEIYTLHRRLNGCFQLAARVGARIRARDILLEAYETHEWYEPGSDGNGAAVNP